MMKKIIIYLVVSVMFVALILSGCAPSASAPASTTPEPASKASKPSDVIELSFSVEHPPMAWTVKEEFTPWIERVEERCGGRVDITIFPAASLNPPPEAYDAAVKGIADIAWIPFMYMPGRFPMVSVFLLPNIAQNFKAGSHMIWDLYHEFPQFEKEHKGVKLLWMHGVPENVIQMADKKVRTLEDIQGVTIRVGGPAAETFKVWGAAPIVTTAPEIYEALDKGVVEGIAFDWIITEAFKVQELTKYATLAPCPGGAVCCVMNLEKFNSLPPDIQQIFIEEGEKHWLEFPDIQMPYIASVIERWKALPDHEVYNLPPEERERWKEKAKPVFDKWLADMEAKGLPGKELLEETFRLGEKYHAIYPTPQ